MFSTKLFGSYLSKLRKEKDMTQSELALKLNLTRQAISSYEVGDCFPDISILVELAKEFEVSIDELISISDASIGEAKIFKKIIDQDDEFFDVKKSDLINLAPILKPSILDKLTKSFNDEGINIDDLVELANYISDESIVDSISKSNFNVLDPNLLNKLIPILNEDSRSSIFQKILDGQIDWHLLKVLLPNRELVEAAVIEGILPEEALHIQYKYTY